MSLGVGNGCQIIVGIVFERNDTAIGSDVLEQIVMIVVFILVFTAIRVNMTDNILTVIAVEPFFGGVWVNDAVGVAFVVIVVNGGMTVSIGYSGFPNILTPFELEFFAAVIVIFAYTFSPVAAAAPLKIDPTPGAVAVTSNQMLTVGIFAHIPSLVGGVDKIAFGAVFICGEQARILS